MISKINLRTLVIPNQDFVRSLFDVIPNIIGLGTEMVRTWYAQRMDLQRLKF